MQISQSGGVLTPQMFTRDHLGSVRSLISNSGSLSDAYDFDPLGRRTLLVGQVDEATLGFTGYWFHNGSNLAMSRYRPYNSSVGKWTNRDPSGEASSFNLYNYSGNNPVTNIDPLGLSAFGDGLEANSEAYANALLGPPTGDYEVLTLAKYFDPIFYGALAGAALTYGAGAAINHFNPTQPATPLDIPPPPDQIPPPPPPPWEPQPQPNTSAQPSGQSPTQCTPGGPPLPPMPPPPPDPGSFPD